MSTVGFAIVGTTLGAFGVAWTEAGIARTWMHDRTPEATRRQVLRTFPQAVELGPPAAVAAAMADVAALLAGERRDLPGDLDMRSVDPGSGQPPAPLSIRRRGR